MKFIKSADPIVIEFAAPAQPKLIGSYFISIHVNNDQGLVIAQCDSRLTGFWLDPAVPQNGRIVIRDLWLKPGAYTVDAYVCQAGVLDAWEGAWRFEVLPDLPYPEFTEASAIEKGMVFTNYSYESR